jgi:hypothetical protein
MESRSDYPHTKAWETPHELTSYLPISLLPIISKVLEKLLLKRLLPMVEKNKLIPNHQFGIRQKHFTVEQTPRIVQEINEALERKQYCSATFLDITQAFDKVCHTGLLYKLKLSLPLNYFLILKSFLQSRHFLVKIENEYTELSPLMQEYPKAAFLGHYFIYYSLQTYQSHQKLHRQPLQTTQQ